MKSAAKIRIGTGAFAFGEWRGKFYPREMTEEESIGYYAKTFSAVELNNTFYKLPAASELGAQAQKTPEDFLFLVKASRFLTHIKRLKDPAEPLRRYLS